MLIRIVRMHFTEAGVDEFLQIFNKHKEAIRNFPGCSHLQLLKDAEDETIYTTLSHWDKEESLENYRKSELFGQVWGRVKTLFAERTQAFSLKKFDKLAGAYGLTEEERETGRNLLADEKGLKEINLIAI